MITSSRNGSRQQGAALLVLFFVILTVSTTVFLSSVNTHAVELRRFHDVRAEMEQSKQGLIAYAMNYHTFGFDNDGDTFTNDEGPGRFLCPDVDNDGLADSSIADCTDYVRGRLPEGYVYNGNQVAINDAFTGTDQQFWYVVSPAFKEITTTEINHNTVGDLTIDGVTGYVAVIIAPGEQLAGQDRTASQTAAANYLEQDNLAGTDFINSYPADPDAFNDQVIGIKASELMLADVRDVYIDVTPNNVLYENARQQLSAYWTANSSLPANATELGVYMQDKGYGWLIDEGYAGTTYTGYYRNTSYPYIRYNLEGCTSYWYWFIPVFPYSPNNTYVSGTPC